MDSVAWRERYPSVGYVAPFLSVLLLIAIPKPQAFVYWEWPLRVLLVSAVCLFVWPPGLSLRPSNSLLSVVLGIAVFALWIAPEVIDPHYRESALFSNALLGHVGSSLAPEALRSTNVLFWRTVRAFTIVPVAEELFWRAWFMRWLINLDFQKVALGAYAPMAFGLTALLFGLEHGPYWDVGLVTGIVYNFWMVRTKSLGNCILVHAVTNLCMSLYVIKYAQWQYWQ